MKNLSERNIAIANRVLRGGETIRSVAIAYEIGEVRARQILHRVCRTMNPVKYESGFHSETYAGGYRNDRCLPYLSFLRENVDAFMPQEAELLSFKRQA